MTAEKPENLIRVGEMLHATIKTPGMHMAKLAEGGDPAFEGDNEHLDFIKNLIASQAEQGADYIDINLDELNANTVTLMPCFVELVRENGKGVPPSIDSSNPEVLLAGLRKWFEYDAAPPPLINSIPYNEMGNYEEIRELRKENPFKAVCLLLGPEGPLASPEKIIEAAKEMKALMETSGFQADDIFFDCVTLGIASDSCMSGMGEIKPSHTHNSFEAIRRMRQDPEMKGVHFIFGVSNWAYGAKKRRIGHIRAYLEAAMQAGADAAIVDVEKDFGIKPAPPELVEFVKMFESLDGADDSMLRYSEAMQNARAQEWL
ncbi:MAG: dihydropteroate synthase [Candidatus Sumerlaeia bacterium]